MQYLISPGGELRGSLRAPGDKSISHRAVMLGSIARGTTRVSGYLDSADVRATLGAVQAMGVRTTVMPDELIIEGVADGRPRPPHAPLDMGNSGTAMRLLTGLLAGLGVAATLTGDASLSRRPMARVIEPLTQMGARIRSRDGLPPLTIEPGAPLTGIEYRLPVASAQVKSALLLAGLNASGHTTVIEPQVTRDHTERMLRQFGCDIETGDGFCRVAGGQELSARSVDVPADISSAAFFMVGAAIAPGSQILLKDVGVNPSRTGVIEILRLMGADLRLERERLLGTEPVADIHVAASSLRGIDVPAELVSLAIDEFPAICVAAACARGTTRIVRAAELRVKESDRITTMARALTALGGEVTEQPDGMTIQGGRLQGGVVDSAGDHRIAMACAIAALACEGEVTVRDCANVATSFPTFVADAASLGLAITAHDTAGV